jgi:ethanolamine ammonia-lyase small subunit
MSDLPATQSSVTPDPWAQLRQHTAARIAMGRAGSSQPTRESLRFSLDHALARDAVHSELDVDRLEKELRVTGLDVIRAATRVSDRATYLKRPDLGRQLSPDSLEQLKRCASPCDLSIVISDGLSAQAAQSNAPALLKELLPRLSVANVKLAPLVIAPFARVAAQDTIGHALQATCGVILIGERPGLGAPDSLGAYLVHAPRLGNTDANRNCVSNIRPAGLSIPHAAETLHHLITQSLALKVSGVGLKDERNVSKMARQIPQP